MKYESNSNGKFDVYKDIQQEELTEDLQMLTNVCGIENMREFLREFQGISFYIPKITRLNKYIIRYIQEHKDESDKKIARRLKVTEPYIKKMRYDMIINDRGEVT